MTLVNLVREAFENAKENGCTFEGMTEFEIATDMYDYHSELDGWGLEDVYYWVCKVRDDYR